MKHYVPHCFPQKLKMLGKDYSCQQNKQLRLKTVMDHALIPCLHQHRPIAEFSLKGSRDTHHWQEDYNESKLRSR